MTETGGAWGDVAHRSERPPLATVARPHRVRAGNSAPPTFIPERSFQQSRRHSVRCSPALERLGVRGIRDGEVSPDAVKLGVGMGPTSEIRLLPVLGIFNA